MARTFADETVETSNTTGIGAYSLEGAKGDYLPFSSTFTTGDQPAYGVRNSNNTKWELNRGAAFSAGSPNTLARGVWKSTNGNAAVSWTSDDLPLTVYVPASAEVHEGVVTGWRAAARPAWLRNGGIWVKIDHPSAGIDTRYYYDGVSDIELEQINTSAHTRSLSLTGSSLPPAPPQGRLTITSLTPVLSSDVTGAAAIYYTPYVGNLAPIYDGTRFVPTVFAELTNTLSDATKNPAAVGTYQVADAFIWNDASTIRLGRGPKWTASAAVSITNASPAVVTWTAHGLWDGATVRFTTTGSLPAGLTASTDYFVTKVDANTFKVSATLANQLTSPTVFINTSSAGSGVHTALNYTKARGTGAGTTELEMVAGVLVNKYDITNGPAARRGTYVGSIYTNASSQIDFKLGSYAAGYGEAFIGIWNAYNRVKVSGTINTSTASWGCIGGGVQKVFNQSATARASMVSGLAEDCVLSHAQAYITCDGATTLYMGMAWRAIAWTYQAISAYSNNGSSSSPFPLATSCTSSPFAGLGYMVPIDTCINYTSSYVNNNSSAFMNYDWRY